MPRWGSFMEEILGALGLALSEEGLTVHKKTVGKHSYLLATKDDGQTEMVTVTPDGGTASVPGSPSFLIPLAHPESIERLIDHLTNQLVPATV